MDFYSRVKAMVENEKISLPADTEGVNEGHPEEVLDDQPANDEDEAVGEDSGVVDQGVQEDSRVEIEGDVQDELDANSAEPSEELIQIDEQEEYDQEEEGGEDEELQFHEGHFEVPSEDVRPASDGETDAEESASSTSSEEEDSRPERPKRNVSAPKFLDYKTLGNPSYGHRGETMRADR